MGTAQEPERVQGANSLEDQLRLVIDATPALIHSGRPDGYLDFFNRRWLEYVGLSLEALSGWRWTDTIHPEDVDEFVKEWRRALATGEPFEAEARVRRADGEYRRLLHQKVPLRDEQGNIFRWYGSSIDIEDRRRAEEALRKSEACLAEAQRRTLQLILDTMTDGVVVCDRDGKFALYNPAARRLLGDVPSDLTLEDAAEYFGFFQLDGITPIPRGESPLARTFKGEPTDEAEFVVRNHQSPEGRIVTEVAKPVWDSEGHLYACVAVMRDVTERRKAERTLLRVEKLAAVGRMAATIAHEINNPLAATMNLLFLASTDQSLSESTRDNLRCAETELKRVVHLTKLSLGFYGETGQPTEVDVPKVVDGVLDSFTSKLRNKSIRIVRKYGGVLRVHAIDGELRQIVSNLIANSIDSMSLNGTLHIRAGPTSFKESRPMVRLSVADSGTGIDPECLNQIFEPFFTTKQSIGTGLGLWVTSELVRKQDGIIRVRSRVGKGTVVTVWIPRELREQIK